MKQIFYRPLLLRGHLNAPYLLPHPPYAKAMSTLIKSCVLGLFLTLSLFSCIDHRLGGSVSPVRLRLKQVEGIFPDGSSINTTYTYDSQNRLSTLSRADGRLSLISYDNPEKSRTLYIEYLKATDRTNGYITLYPYNLDGTTFEASRYTFAGVGPDGINPSAPLASIPISGRTGFFRYEFDGSRHLTFYSREFPLGTNVRPSYTYTYTGDDITATIFSQLRDQYYLSTTYDDKINPLFGLLDPDIDPALRFSRHNVVSQETRTSSFTSPPSNLLSRYEIAYEYNQQGLPVKRTATQDGKTYVITYAYESY